MSVTDLDKHFDRNALGQFVTGNHASYGPRKWRDPALLQKAIDDFFAMCDASGRAYTVIGLTLHLGFCGPEDLLALASYIDDDDLRPIAAIIKRAKNRCVDYVEQHLLRSKTNVAGYIFWLKNHGWSDNCQITGEGGGPVNVRFVSSSKVIDV